MLETREKVSIILVSLADLDSKSKVQVFMTAASHSIPRWHPEVEHLALPASRSCLNDALLQTQLIAYTVSATCSEHLASRQTSTWFFWTRHQLLARTLSPGQARQP